MTGGCGTVVRRADGQARLAFRREFPDPVDEVWGRDHRPGPVRPVVRPLDR
ncbi:hypothetical protein HBB16_03035 [Pseudonocardia sp. MCCB 268]|nr:hypothetical protein [Pseudonocardia cytotoxica]